MYYSSIHSKSNNDSRSNSVSEERLASNFSSIISFKAIILAWISCFLSSEIFAFSNLSDISSNLASKRSNLALSALSSQNLILSSNLVFCSDTRSEISHLYSTLALAFSLLNSSFSKNIRSRSRLWFGDAFRYRPLYLLLLLQRNQGTALANI